jgi:L-ascorbate metabolism protein UlaG (beta-lactamase superfamily)
MDLSIVAAGVGLKAPRRESLRAGLPLSPSRPVSCDRLPMHRVLLAAIALLLPVAACEDRPAPAPAASSASPPAKPKASAPAASSSVAAAASSAGAGAGASASASAPAWTQSVPPDTPASDTITTSAGPLEVTPIRHGTVMLAFGGKRFVVDPSGEAAIAKVQKPVDVIFVTDIHGDHLDPETLEKLKGPKTEIVAPPSVADKWKGVTVVLKNGEKKDVAGVKVEAVPMYNLVRGPDGGLFHDKGRGDGFVIGFGDKRVYLSGDTECTPEMKALEKIDVAFVCMNVPYTMPPSEAAACVNAFKPKIVYPYHFRGSNLDEFTGAIAKGSGIEVRVRRWY